MKLARYVGNGEIAILDEPEPQCPSGGLLVRTEASGLCSGELMDWYMDRKIPHVLGHEVAGIVKQSENDRFPVGCRVFVHHHAPCLECDLCRLGLHVHCEQWKRTKLVPGGMAEEFAVPAENLTDSFLADDLPACDAALIEPLGCVMKSVSIARRAVESGSSAVIGLGVMGLMHALVVPGAIGYDLNPARLDHARKLEIEAKNPAEFEDADVIFVCPGSKSALDLAVEHIKPGGTIVLFAPMPPGAETPVDLNRLYFRDVRLLSSYSCGPDHTRAAKAVIERRQIRAEHVVSDFIGIEELPEAYRRMKAGEILKPMVLFPDRRN